MHGYASIVVHKQSVRAPGTPVIALARPVMGRFISDEAAAADVAIAIRNDSHIEVDKANDPISMIVDTGAREETLARDPTILAASVEVPRLVVIHVAEMVGNAVVQVKTGVDHISTDFVITFGMKDAVADPIKTVATLIQKSLSPNEGREIRQVQRHQRIFANLGCHHGTKCESLGVCDRKIG